MTAQAWATVAATLGAAFLGAILAYIGSSRQQRKQAERDALTRREEADKQARLRLERALAELLAAAQDLVMGVRVLRHSQQRRNQPRFWLRFAAMVLRDWPDVRSWRELGEPNKLEPLIGTVLEADRYQLDESHILVLDFTANVTTKANRYLAVAALITLGEDREIADAVRKLTTKVTAVMDAITARNRDFERLSSELQAAMEDFRDVADERLGNTTAPKSISSGKSGKEMRGSAPAG